MKWTLARFHPCPRKVHFIKLLNYYILTFESNIDFGKNCIKLEQLYMRNSQISSVSSKFETWGLEKANLKVIDLSENRKMDKNSALSLVDYQLLTRSK